MSEDRLAYNAENPLAIAKVIQGGNAGHFDDAKTVRDLYAIGGRVLDHSGLADTVLFLGEDGKHYVGSYEFAIGEADPAFVRETLEEIEAEQEEEKEFEESLARLEAELKEPGGPDA